MTWEQDGLRWGGDSTKSVSPVQLVDEYGIISECGGPEKNV